MHAAASNLHASEQPMAQPQQLSSATGQVQHSAQACSVYSLLMVSHAGVVCMGLCMSKHAMLVMRGVLAWEGRGPATENALGSYVGRCGVTPRRRGRQSCVGWKRVVTGRWGWVGIWKAGMGPVLHGQNVYGCIVHHVPGRCVRAALAQQVCISSRFLSAHTLAAAWRLWDSVSPDT